MFPGVVVSRGTLVVIDNEIDIALPPQVTAFVHVTLEKDDRKQRDFLAAVEAEEHIAECHVMSGFHDYLMKILAYSMDHFSELCLNRILKFPGVKNIESNLSLLAVKEGGALPVR